MGPRSCPRQLALFDPAPSASAGVPCMFVRGAKVDRSGVAQYVHLIRDPNDPERSPRPVGGRLDRAPHRTLAEVAVESCRSDIVGLLSDGEPRTFNAIGVELLDHTADTLFLSPYDEALWQLVEEGLLEHTLEAPIFFRLALELARPEVPGSREAEKGG
jgi:hypothetical protein